jgi:adenylate cyclase class 2
MDIVEYEATYENIDKDEMRKCLQQVGAKLLRPEFLMKRLNFYPPLEKRNQPGWIRVRDEGDKTTMSFKADHVEEGIAGQKEICVEVKDYEKAIAILDTILERKAYQETKREIWELDNVEIDLDTWPWLESFVEIEGKNEMEVKAVSAKLGFDYNQALFCAVGELYQRKYGMPYADINNKIKFITFETENPFTN